MSDLEELTNDYSREPVPEHQLVNGWKVALVVFGIGFTLPIYYLGSELGLRLGLARAAFAFFAGGLLLGIVAAATAYVGARTRLSSYMIIEFSFGRKGAKLVNILMAAGLLGYYATTADIFGLAIQDTARHVFGAGGIRALYSLGGSVLMTITAIFGFNAIKRLANFTVPIMSVFLSVVAYLAVRHAGWAAVTGFHGQAGASLGLAVSTVIGSCVQGAVLMPDLARFARSGRDGIKASVGSTLGYPAIFLVSAIATIATGEKDIMMIIIGLGLMVLAFFTLILSTWSTNTINLYSTSLTLATVFTKVKDWKLTLGAAVIGTALAVAGIKDYTITFFLVLGAVTPPVAGIYLVDYFLFSNRSYSADLLDRRAGIRWPAFVAWGLGSLIGYLATEGVVRLTTVAAVDSLFVAAISYFVISKYLRAKRPHFEPVGLNQEL